MRCPYCKEDNDRVVDSRSGEEGRVTRRRRECLSCRKRYTTYERVEESPLRVIKKDGAREAFSSAKLRAGIEKACWNLPVSAAAIDAVVDRIEHRILESNEREVTSETVGEHVMRELRGLHQVAYVRFASVYREFKDVTEFMQVLQEFVRSTNGERSPDPEGVP
jgi:transcriptional repressor NrdR